jgi:acetylornithine deacetylase/succinyl-diaminopimelate desuccinylase-like protein
LRGDWALVPDIGHSLTAADVAEKGVAFIEVECRGRSAHGSTPELGASAVLALAEFLAEVEAWEPEHRHPLLGRPTANVGTISGGSAPNMVPDRAVAQIDCRYLPGMTAGDCLGVLQELGRRVAGRRPGTSFALRQLVDWPPSEVAHSSPIVEAVRSIAPRITGRPVELIGLGGATFCKSCLAAGIPAVGFGPGAAGAAHTAGESVEVRELVQFAAFLAALARHLLGVQP